MAFVDVPDSSVRWPAWFQPAPIGPEHWTPHALHDDTLALTGYDASVYIGQRECGERAVQALVTAADLMIRHEVIRAALVSRPVK